MPRKRKNPEFKGPSDYSPFSCNQKWIRIAYQDDPDNVPDWVREKIIEHFKKRPFDKLRLGLLKIVDKKGNLVWFEPNAEQRRMLEWIEQEYYAERPVEIIVLKDRQIGISTFSEAVNYCVSSISSYKTAHTVCDLEPKAEHMMRMFNRFWDNEPEWLRPKKSKGKIPKFHDPEKDIVDTEVIIESAERRDNIARGYTFQFNHLSEMAYWPQDCQAAIMNTILSAIPNGWPSIRIEEFTGNRRDDIAYERYFQAKNGELGNCKAFFFPVQEHEEYREPLAMSEEEFINSLTAEDRERMEKHNVSAESMNWYVERRKKEVLSGAGTFQMFRREYPMDEDEAFIGASSNFFEPKRNKTDLERTALINNPNSPYKSQLAVEPSRLPLSCSRKDADQYERLVYCRFDLFTDADNFCKAPAFSYNPFGDWWVWEMPRDGHEYIVTIDSSRGEEKQKNVTASKDYDDVDVWRTTNEPWEKPAHVQVAQFRFQQYGPQEVAQEAVAASVLYGNRKFGAKALIVPENNAHGLVVVHECMRLNANLYLKRTLDQYGHELSRKVGFYTSTGSEATSGTKNFVLNQFRKLWMGGHVQVNSNTTAKEMSTFANINGVLKAIGTNHDDTVIAAALFPEGVRALHGDQDGLVPITVNTNAQPENRDEDGDEIPRPIRRRRYSVRGGDWQIDDSRIERFGDGRSDSTNYGI